MENIHYYYCSHLLLFWINSLNDRSLKVSESAPGECSFEEKQKSFCWIFSYSPYLWKESSGPPKLGQVASPLGSYSREFIFLSIADVRDDYEKSAEQ